VNKKAFREWVTSLPPVVNRILAFLLLFTAFYLTELLCFCFLKPGGLMGLVFGALWAGLLAGFVLFLPRTAGRIVFGILYFPAILWALAQIGYYSVFHKLMWLSTVAYAGEGAAFLTDVLKQFPFLWWVSLALLPAVGVLIIWKFPKAQEPILQRLPYLGISVLLLVGLCLLPKAVKKHTAYTAMFDAKEVYNITGIYQLTLRDLWGNEIYPLTPAYKKEQAESIAVITQFFAGRNADQANEMTGKYAGKNVILVLMESMDDWMITYQDTPTLRRMMKEGITFSNFYTPGYGSARTLNSEFCMNTGVYLPTTGSNLSDYMGNSFDQSIASRLTANGYSAKVFHYNTARYYNRDVLTPAMGYENYVAYSDYTTDPALLCQDTILFDLPQVKEQFFREGTTFNTIITRSAHLGYTYNEIIGYYAFKRYPEYLGLYGSEEENCARVKARVVDDMFARLLKELEEQGQLESTVIIGMTDHYTYGYKNIDELLAHSNVDSQLLLEKVPCFIWSADKPGLAVDKTLNTADLLPTMLNLLGIDSPYDYLGQDAFDPNYKGYAIFPDGSWVCDGVAWQDGQILMNTKERAVTQEEIDAMAALSQQYRAVSNLLLSTDYYRKAS